MRKILLLFYQPFSAALVNRCGEVRFLIFPIRHKGKGVTDKKIFIMKKSVKNSIKKFAKNSKVLTKSEIKKLKGGITGSDVMLL